MHTHNFLTATLKLHLNRQCSRYNTWYSGWSQEDLADSKALGQHLSYDNTETASFDSEPDSTTRSGTSLWAVWAVTAAFGTYFCMYAFRKPFTAAKFDDITWMGLTFKSVLVTSQVIGYSLSKFIGIKIISEMPPSRRAATLLALIGLSEMALIFFGLIPPPWNAIFMFFNGLPLGMVFGLVMGFLEGRRVTEALSAGLCASFILADGATKSVGAWLLEIGVSEYWMPAAAGGLFTIPLVIGVIILARTPPPDIQDIKARSERIQMTREDRWMLLRRYGFGLTMLVSMYLLVTILRSIRADFATEIWIGLGEPAAPQTFTTSEILVALGVVAINGSMVLVRDNRRAFRLSLLTCLAGFILLGSALMGRQWGLGAFPFMVLVGLGLYLPYVAVHATIFERLLAMTREKGNIGFLIYVADSIGYLGYVGCMLFKGAFDHKGAFLPFFTAACWTTCALSIVCILAGMRYFGDKRLAESP